MIKHLEEIKHVSESVASDLQAFLQECGVEIVKVEESTFYNVHTPKKHVCFSFDMYDTRFMLELTVDSTSAKVSLQYDRNIVRNHMLLTSVTVCKDGLGSKYPQNIFERSTEFYVEHFKKNFKRLMLL